MFKICYRRFITWLQHSSVSERALLICSSQRQTWESKTSSQHKMIVFGLNVLLVICLLLVFWRSVSISSLQSSLTIGYEYELGLHKLLDKWDFLMKSLSVFYQASYYIFLVAQRHREAKYEFFKVRKIFTVCEKILKHNKYELWIWLSGRVLRDKVDDTKQHREVNDDSHVLLHPSTYIFNWACGVVAAARAHRSQWNVKRVIEKVFELFSLLSLFIYLFGNSNGSTLPLSDATVWRQMEEQQQITGKIIVSRE